MSNKVIPEQIVTNPTINFLKSEREKIRKENEVMGIALQNIYDSLKNECEQKVRALLNFQDFNFNVTEHSMTFNVFDPENSKTYGMDVKINRFDRYNFDLGKKVYTYDLSYSTTTIKLDQPSYHLNYIKLVGEIAENNSAFIVHYEKMLNDYSQNPMTQVYSNNWDKVRHLSELINKEVNSIVDKQYEETLKNDVISLKSCLTESTWRTPTLNEVYDFQIEIGRSISRYVKMIEVVKRNKTTVVINIISDCDSSSYRKNTETVKIAVFESIVRRAVIWNTFGALNKTLSSIEKYYRSFKYEMETKQ